MGKGGGGGSSGAVNYPSYLKQVHLNLLTGWPNPEEGTVDIELGVLELMNYCMRATPITVTNSPYSGATVVDPDDVFFETAHALSDYTGQSAFELLTLFLAETPESLYTAYADDAGASAMITAFTDDLDAQYDNTIVPSMAAGYADLNATMSSAYSIGLAGIAEQKIREVAKFTGHIKTTQAMQRMQMKVEWRRTLSALSVENGRIYLAAKHEEEADAIGYDVKDVLWDLELFHYGNNALAAIAGAATSKGNDYKPSALGSALSGAAMGAMAGASIGGPTGAAIGAGTGAVLGYASTL